MTSPIPTFEGVPFTLLETPEFKTGKKDQYTNVATEMALVHNCFMRAFNGIYHIAPVVKPCDYKDFVSYAHAVYEGLEAHHMGEETYGFPGIEAATGAKGIMDANIDQHAAFHDGLHNYATYLSSLLANDITLFSGHHLRNIIDSFAPALNQHLHDEIPTLLALSKYGDSLDLAGIINDEGQKVLGPLSKSAILPAILLNHDVTFEGGMHTHFPPIPLPVKWVFNNVFTLWNYRWWRFATCDSHGIPKTVENY